MKGRKTGNVVPMKTLEGIPPPPSWLPPAGKAEWARAAADLNGRGLLFQGALASLAMYCNLVAVAQGYQAILADQGPVLEDGQPNPAAKIMVATAAQARLYAAELGLSVTSRTRAATAAKAGTEDDSGPSISSLLVV